MAEDGFQPNADRLVANNAAFAAGFNRDHLDVRPSARLAVVACMDSRMPLFPILGLEPGEAHVIRNAGGVVTDDVIRSLCLSQRYLGTREIVLVHHTDCGLERVSDDEFRRDLEADTGVAPSWALESFGDPAADVRQSMNRIRLSPFIGCKEHIRGFVYDVDTGLLDEVG